MIELNLNSLLQPPSNTATNTIIINSGWHIINSGAFILDDWPLPKRQLETTNDINFIDSCATDNEGCRWYVSSVEGYLSGTLGTRVQLDVDVTGTIPILRINDYTNGSIIVGYSVVNYCECDGDNNPVYTEYEIKVAANMPITITSNASPGNNFICFNSFNNTITVVYNSYSITSTITKTTAGGPVLSSSNYDIVATINNVERNVKLGIAYTLGVANVFNVTGSTYESSLNQYLSASGTIGLRVKPQNSKSTCALSNEIIFQYNKASNDTINILQEKINFPGATYPEGELNFGNILNSNVTAGYGQYTYDLGGHTWYQLGRVFWPFAPGNSANVLAGSNPGTVITVPVNLNWPQHWPLHKELNYILKPGIYTVQAGYNSLCPSYNTTVLSYYPKVIPALSQVTLDSFLALYPGTGSGRAYVYNGVVGGPATTRVDVQQLKQLFSNQSINFTDYGCFMIFPFEDPNIIRADSQNLATESNIRLSDLRLGGIPVTTPLSNHDIKHVITGDKNAPAGQKNGIVVPVTTYPSAPLYISNYRTIVFAIPKTLSNTFTGNHTTISGTISVNRVYSDGTITQFKDTVFSIPANYPVIPNTYL